MDKKNFEETYEKIGLDVKKIKTFKEFNQKLKEKDRKYNEFLVSDFRKEKPKEIIEPLNQFLNIRITEKEKELISHLKTKKINISLHLRNFLKTLDSEKFYELHLEEIKLKKIEIKKINREINLKIINLSENLFKEFNEKNAEDRYILKYEIKDLQIKRNKIENYLKQFIMR